MPLLLGILYAEEVTKTINNRMDIDTQHFLYSMELKQYYKYTFIIKIFNANKFEIVKTFSCQNKNERDEPV